MNSNKVFLLEHESIKKLSTYHIPYPKYALVRSLDEAVNATHEFTFPVVLKVVSRDAVHKSDVGGVIVNLNSVKEVIAGFNTITANVKKHNPKAEIEGMLIVEQAPPGIEVIIGALEDPTFGATVMFGLGGIFAEVLKDVTFRIAPLTKHDAEQMIREIKGFPLLTGARGNQQCDLDAIVDLLMEVSKLVSENPQIKELDLNPVRVYEKGLLVLDARMMI